MKEKIERILIELKKDDERLYYEIFLVSSLKENGNYKEKLNFLNLKYGDNKNLANLGDSCIKFIFTEFLIKQKEDKRNLTKKRDLMESNETFAQIVKENEFEKYWKTLFPNHEYEYTKNDKATLFEAIIGGIYFYKGFDFTKNLLIENIQCFCKDNK